MNTSAYREPGRYLLAGGACAVASNLVLIGSDRLGQHYAVSVFLSFVLVTPVSYWLHAFWTFEVTPSWGSFARFTMGLTSSLILASATVALFRGMLGLPMLIAAPIATVTMTLYNFFAARWSVRSGRQSS